MYTEKESIIILLCGCSGVGKSTSASYLKNKFINSGKKVVISPYTKYLKRYVEEINDRCIDKIKDRRMLQTLSSDLIKKTLHNDCFFINRQLEDINIYKYFFDIIIIDDVRFPSEIDVIKDRYNRCISILINSTKDNNLSIIEKRDVTEVSLDNYNGYDYVINNNSDINSLYKELDIIYKNMESRDFNGNSN